ncbi:hypothetical protein JOF47_003462 [Paeniglutamicibacter kerguelensis]|uniref:Uncharacterized protein n=1 Tax=Paeniglutamicibacter kerguelensis TaxID=254788 RepID=A0ABS4XHJ6_9MICC|nr:hypothetical protein [Paeniglutamicibacter kerguelensis]
MRDNPALPDIPNEADARLRSALASTAEGVPQ